MAGVLVLAVLVGLIVFLQNVRERTFLAAETTQTLYVRSPAVMTRMALTYDAVVADVYWIRAIQYYGRTRLSESKEKHYDLLYPLLDLTTSLDPRFSIAYRFGAFFLSETAPGGAGRPDLAIQLLEKGMRANPDRWEYPHDIAFVHYRRADYLHAAEWFRRAAQVPGAADWLGPMAAVTLARGGDRTSSRQLWQNIVSSSEESWIKRTGEHRLQQLDAMDQIENLNAVVRQYEARTGAPPQTWAELVGARMLPGIPVDPANTPYELNPWWGDITVGQSSRLWPLPTQMP